MPYAPIRPVPLLLVLAGLVPAVELPVVAVTVTPRGAIVERAGTMPAGDTLVTGLPLRLSAAEVAVTVVGVEAPRWQVRVDAPERAALPEALLREQEAADAAVVAAERAMERAGLRRSLAEEALNGNPPVGEQVPPLPTAEAIAALGGFLADNRAKAYAEQAEALAAHEAAMARLAAVDEQIVAARPRAAATAQLILPEGAGRAVRVVYRLDGAQWEPAYRLRIVAGAATLMPEARIRAPADDVWGAVPITCITRSASADLLLPELSIPQLGVADTVARLAQPREAAMADVETGGEGVFMAIGAGGGSSGMFGSRTGGGKKRAISRHGGSYASESVVDAVSRRLFKSTQRQDGSWSDGPSPIATTALVTLAILGAGYDHRTPNKYKSMVKPAIGWLVGQPPERCDLADLALATCALCEAYAMTNDPELKAPCEIRLAALSQRVVGGGEASAWINRSGAFAGPEIIAWLAMAAKSGIAGGLDVPDDLGSTILALRSQAKGGDADEARLAVLLVDIFLGGSRPTIDAVEAQRWAGLMPSWYRRGRIELIQLATLICFQSGGEAWQRWNAVSRDFLVSKQEPSGLWFTAHPAGQTAGSALCTLCLEVYYRYSPGAAGRAGVDSDVVSEPVLGDALVAAQGWPVRWRCPAVALTPGAINTVPLAPIALDGSLAWRAIPVFDERVWRSLPTRNPLAQPLPAGRCAVELEGVDLASVVLPFVRPGAPFVLPLGAEDSVRALREPTTTSDDGVRSRTLTVDLGFRIEAPAGFAGVVTIVEPLPQPRGEGIELTLREPALKGAELQARFASDPYWRTDLRLGEVKTWGWKLRYPTTLRPALEYLP